MKKISILLLFLTLLFSCQKSNNSTSTSDETSESTTATSFADFPKEVDPMDMEISDDDDVQKYLDATGDYPDGTYCAEVEYYNSSTGTRRSYDLDVEVQNGDLVQIDWPNGGWLDSTHFSPDNISSGEVRFTSDKGYRYTVTIGSFGGGCSGGRSLQNAVNSDLQNEQRKVEEETCPECGFSKFSYDEYCSSCERKLTCSDCGRKKSRYDDLCYSCNSKKQDEERRKRDEDF